MKRVTEARLETLEKTASQVMMVSKVKTVQLVYPVCPVKWVLVVFLVREASPVFLVHQVFLVVKD